MSDSTDLITKTGIIPRLAQNNYPAWAKAIKFALIGMDVWSIVDGSEVEPDAAEANTQSTRDELQAYCKR